jgi:ferredoxin
MHLSSIVTASCWISLLFATLSDAWTSSIRMSLPSSVSIGRRRSTMLLATNTSADDPSIDSNSNIQEHSIHVSYEGRSCEVPVRQDETILSALERSGAADKLSLPSLPSDCRRGNCLTCSARHVENSEKVSLVRAEDGLSPYMSKQVKKNGYILTCSSHVVGEGLKLELGENHKAWDDMYRLRVEGESAKVAGWRAMAKTVRMSDERNPDRWVVETEAVLEEKRADS